SDCSGDPPFRDFLRRVRDTALGAYAHQDLPFERLVEALHPERSLDRAPVVQVMFVLQDPDRPPLDLAGLTVSPVEVHTSTAKFDLSLSVREIPQGLRVSIEYSTDLFEAVAIERMLGHYEQLLDGIVADPAQPLSALPLLSAPERHQLLVDWNDTRREFPSDTTLHALVEAQVERTPDAVAVVFEDQRLTYRELDRRANQLARHLRTLGVGPDTFVALCLRRSLDLVIGLLGILKAGAAYLPLDPSHPAERLRFMLADARPLLVLTQECLLSRVPSDTVPVLCLDRDRARFDGEDPANPSVACRPDELAYVVYTSGSTGRPKGTLIAHRGVVNCLAFVTETCGLVPEDSALWLTTISFDASVRCLFGPLATGGRVVLVSDEEASDPLAVLSRIHKQQVTTILAIVPTMLRALTTAAEEAARPAGSLRFVLLSGEALAAADCRRAQAALCPAAQIVNLYGPTECTMVSTYHFLTHQDLARDVVPIGRPIANARIYILDRALNPVPVGVPGEIHLGGVGLACGYVNRPELTADRFISDPFGSGPRARLYKTGDLARYLADGTIEFLGRLDYQVKVGGIRVELGEIEAVLGQHPAVREAVVVLREDEPGNARLAAYVTLRTRGASLSSDLRHFLRETLPEHMVPAGFVVLDALPLTPNGKVDRRALPRPNQADVGSSLEFVAPRTPVEEALAAIWADVVGLERVGAHDSFFELGGHSLLGTRVMARLRATFGVELPIRRLFEFPTVAGLASEIEAALRGPRDREAPPIQPVSREAPLPLSFAQLRLWFLEQLSPGSAAYNMCSAFRLQGVLDEAALQHSLQAIVDRHEALRSTFAGAGEGEPVQLIAPQVGVTLLLTDLGELPEAERAAEARRFVLAEGQRPFDLERGPLFRPALLRLRQDEHILVLAMHHIVSDGWSMGVVCQEFAALYRAFTRGEPDRLRALPIQYADYAAWQRQWLQGEALASQLAYWTRQLEGAPAHLELPTDHPRPPVLSPGGAQVVRLLPPPLSGALKALGRREGATHFMTLAAAFQTLLHRYTGQDDLVVGTAIAGRQRVEIEP
ncbi:MAG: amino acid adenylation domain-containing protein, partial [Candidatus Rokubacteria bacterium]|nr:amino acid adenylation domain-containing protein [Candidatus Rokubacteria bacterium]